MFEYFIISDHAAERYRERVSDSIKDIKKSILRELHYKKVLRIVTIGRDRHVFTRTKKEFVFEKTRGVWVLKTVIRRSSDEHKNRIKNKVAMTK